jgi:hypothetical protein
MPVLTSDALKDDPAGLAFLDATLRPAPKPSRVTADPKAPRTPVREPRTPPCNSESGTKLRRSA